MQPISQAVLLSWSIPPAASFALALTAFLYLRGWILLRRAGVPFLPLWRAISFLLGLLSLWVALASPLDTFSGFVLTAHMLQHMMLMMVAPPLILLGAPLIPLVRGLPVFAAREFAGPFLNWRLANRVGTWLTSPVVALILMGVVMFGWHTPRLYDLALSSGSWHEVEHACFFVTSLIFWWPVVQPWPSRSHWARWAVVPYLLIADLQNTILSAILIFSDRVIYLPYLSVPRLFGFSALQDQVAAGAIMWVVGSLAFMVPAIVVAVECLQSKTSSARAPARKDSDRFAPARIIATSQRRPQGRFLRRHFGGGTAEALSFLVLFAAAGLCMARLSAGSGDDDDQVLRLSEQSGRLAVAVFALPGSLETGPAEFNVVVQDRSTQEVLRDTTIDLRAQQTSDSQPTKSVRASTEDSENRLLQSAELEFPTEGNWTLSITARHGSDAADFALPLQIVKPDAGIEVPWPYIALLILGAVLLLTYFRRHRTPRITRLPETPDEDSVANVPGTHAG